MRLAITTAQKAQVALHRIATGKADVPDEWMTAREKLIYDHQKFLNNARRQ